MVRQTALVALPPLRFPGLAGNRTQLSLTGSELIEMECQQMKSNENEITTHLNGSSAVPFTMTIKIIVISNQYCFDGEWNALYMFVGHWIEALQA